MKSTALRLVSGFAFLLSVSSTFSQDRLVLKYYQNVDVYKLTEKRFNGSSANIFSSTYKTHITRPSLAIFWRSGEKIANEIEFSFAWDASPPIQHFYIYRSIDPKYIKQVFIQVSYEVSGIIRKEADNGFITMRLGLDTYAHQRTESPKYGSFHATQYDFGSTLNAIPRAVFSLYPRIKIEFNSKIGLIDLRNNQYYLDNPQVPEKDRRMKNTSWNYFPKRFNFRIGLQYAIK